MAKNKEKNIDRKVNIEEKAKAKKEQEARIKKRLKAERKKLDKITTFPYKFLFYLGAIIGIIGFLWFFFGQNQNVSFSLLKGFSFLAIVYIGGGIVFFVWVLIIARMKQKEFERKRLIEEESQREREKAELEGKLERELLLKQATEKREQELKKLKEQLSKSEENTNTNKIDDFETLNLNQ